LSLIICSCVTGPKYLSFDDALETGIEKIQNELPEGTQIAILDFKSDNKNLSSYIIEEMYDKLVNSGKLSIMERSRIDTIRMEVDYQLSGEVDDNQIINIGKQLGADFVVTGEIAFSGEAYRLRIFAIDIEKGRRVASSSLNINRNDRQINYLLTINQPVSINKQPSVEIIYKIGDFGPAGGLIFYDKGIFSGGWRYLEVAPAETEFSMIPWGGVLAVDELKGLVLSELDVWGTSNGIGFGKRNTQLIVDRLEQLEIKIERSAAQLCVNLNFDGYNDWFLPSIDELKLMYSNLKQNGLGNFESTRYASSSPLGIGYVQTVNFRDGEHYYWDAFAVSDFFSVRAIRAF